MGLEDRLQKYLIEEMSLRHKLMRDEARSFLTKRALARRRRFHDLTKRLIPAIEEALRPAPPIGYSSIREARHIGLGLGL